MTLTDKEITLLYCRDYLVFARTIEARVHEELRKQEPVAWVVVRQSVLDVGNGDDVRTGGRPELGYALLENSVTYRNEDQASAAIKAKGLPLGWVYMPLSRLLPNLAAPIPPTARPDTEVKLPNFGGFNDGLSP